MDIVITILIVGVVVYFLMNRGSKKTGQHTGNENSAKPPPSSKRGGGYGKWLGGGLGWAFGGPIGGILGFVFGSMYDGMQSGQYAYQPDSSKTQTGDFTASLLVLSAAVMKADEKVLRSELEFVKSFFIRQFGVNKAEQDILLLREILLKEINLFDVCLQIKQYMEYPSRLQLLHFLFGISIADGITEKREIEVIDQIANYLGISQPDYLSIKNMFVKDTDSAYKILEISKDASDEEVKKAYRSMATKYHPDKVSHLGEDIKKAATEKFQALQAAYEEIKKERGLR